MIPVPYSAGHSRRANRAASTPCAICGRGVGTSRYYVHIHNGGADLVTEAEAAELNRTGHEAADMYFFPVGRDCYRRHPEIHPYVTVVPRETSQPEPTVGNEAI